MNPRENNRMRTCLIFALLFPIFISVSANEDPEYVLSFDVLGLMKHVLYPSAAVVWSNAGFVITETGEQNLAPTTEEGWHNVEDHAAMIMESANLLIMPGRGPQEAEWITLSKSLVKTGRLALNAAQAKDAEALFDAGGELYQSCLACHQKYIISEQ